MTPPKDQGFYQPNEITRMRREAADDSFFKRLMDNKAQERGTEEDKSNADAFLREMFGDEPAPIPSPPEQAPVPAVQMEDTLNPCQRRAFDDITDFIQGGGDRMSWLLEGFAGTGKSYTVNALMGYIARRSPNINICYAAPTHAALQVLREGSPEGRAHRDHSNPARLTVSPVSFMTIAQLLSLKKVVDEKTGKEDFRAIPSSKAPPIESFSVIIADESSMDPERLLNDMIAYQDRVILIFVGDGAQLAPVGEPVNPLFRSRRWRERHKIGHSILDQPMRQEGGSPLLDLATAIREGEWERPDGIDRKGVKHLTSRDLPNLLKRTLTSEEYAADSRRIRVLAYTNEMVANVNEGARKIHLNNDNPPPIIQGERILVTAPVVEYDGSIVVNNGTELRVLEAMPTEVSLNDAPKVKGGGSSTRFRGFRCRVEDIPAFGQPMRSMVNLLHPDDAGKFLQWKEEWFAHCRKEKQGATWAAFYKLAETFISWQFPYAMTTHKAQGGTFTEAAMMVKDMDRMRQHDPLNWRRLMYVAATRAKETGYFVQ